MVLKQPLYQQNDVTDQSADVLRLLVRDLTNERPGIVQGNAMRVTQRGAGANNSVDVGAGAVIVPGTSATNQGYYYVFNDATANVPMSTPAHGSLPRIDTVIVAVRDQFYSGSSNDAQLVYVPGTAAASPSAPDIAAAGHSNYWRLANISVPANDNTITTAEITDLRTSPTIIPAQGAANALGGCVLCTSSSRPSLPRGGQLIWETDTKRMMVNEGSPDTPNWQPVSHNNSWSTFVPSYTNISIGFGGTQTGRYIKLGRLAFADFDFVLGLGGTVTGRIIWTPPSEIAMRTDVNGCVSTAVAADATTNDRFGGVSWHVSGEASISRWASDGTDTGWSGTQPFTWAVNDHFRAFAFYETST